MYAYVCIFISILVGIVHSFCESHKNVWDLLCGHGRAESVHAFGIVIYFLQMFSAMFIAILGHTGPMRYRLDKPARTSVRNSGVIQANPLTR